MHRIGRVGGLLRRDYLFHRMTPVNDHHPIAKYAVR
jgi:hypothetical protein